MERDAEVSQTATRQNRHSSVSHSLVRSLKRVQGILPSVLERRILLVRSETAMPRKMTT